MLIRLYQGNLHGGARVIRNVTRIRPSTVAGSYRINHLANTRRFATSETENIEKQNLPDDECDPHSRDDSKSLDPFNVVFIGAAGLNFGNIDGPWNQRSQSDRFERLLGRRLRVPAIIDPNHALVETTIENKRFSAYEPNQSYQDTRGFATVDDYLSSSPEVPHLVVVGAHPFFRPKIMVKGDIETRIAEGLPGTALMLEKPISLADDISKLENIASVLRSSGTLVSVSYVQRYLKAVRKVKQTVNNIPTPVMATHARLTSSYITDTRPWTWNQRLSGGPMIHQGTDLCDLSRHLANTSVPISSKSPAVEQVNWNDHAGQLAVVPVTESAIPESERIPRATAGVWKYASGAVGTFLHTMCLQDPSPFPDMHVEVHADGYLFKLCDLFNKPTLVTHAGDHGKMVSQFPDDDPYLHEIAAVVDAIEKRNKGRDGILCDYEDALETYKLAWATAHET
ncbi:putative oxidoreductase C terminal-domain-containing protein [Phlyctochytrium arcticum]|nr:putative oxidoreductase C terminal-domain-containing protein [Phlyctochytrium arcticum]